MESASLGEINAQRLKLGIDEAINHSILASCMNLAFRGARNKCTIQHMVYAFAVVIGLAKISIKPSCQYLVGGIMATLRPVERIGA